MFSKVRKWQIGIAAAIFVLSILVMQDPEDLSTTFSGAELNTQRGDYYLRQADMVLTDSSGQPLYNLTADKMDYFATDEHAKVHDLQLDYYATAGDLNNHWRFDATDGFVPTGGLLIELRNGVKAQQIFTQNSDLTPLNFNTNRLDIYLNEDTAVAPHSKFQQGQNTLSTDELRVYLQENLIEMEGGIQAEYQPANPVP